MDPLINAIQNSGSLPRYVPWHMIGKKCRWKNSSTTVVHLALEKGRVDLLLGHLTAAMLRERDDNQQTPLHLAAISGCLGRIPESLVAVKDMMARDNKGWTPLHCAVEAGKLAAVPKRLLDTTTIGVTDNEGRNVADCAFYKGDIGEIPQELRCLSIDGVAKEMKEEAEADKLDHPKFSDSDFLLQHPPFLVEPTTWFHWLAGLGRLRSLPSSAIRDDVSRLRDSAGKTPLHVSVENFGMRRLPLTWMTREHLLVSDDAGRTAFHRLAEQSELGGAPLKLFNRDVLTACDQDGVSVADVLDEHGQTRLLPIDLRGLARRPALMRLRQVFEQDFDQAEGVWKSELTNVLPRESFEKERVKFVRDWSGTRFKFALDDEQAKAVIESGGHLLVSARAGSGKTGTLVARALFEIEKRKSDPHKMVILAFNNNAARQVRERLVEKVGQERCPHVMTFHSLAYRLVHPEKGSILMDENNSDEGKALSQVLNGIIDDQIRNGTLVAKIRKIMMLRWMGEWNEIVNAGGQLPSDEVLKIREARRYHSIDGRYFESSMEKVIADELVKRGRTYKHRAVAFRRSGLRYTPAFLAFDEGRKIVIDIEGTADPACLRARDFYWNGDQSSGAVRIELPDAEHCGGIEEFRNCLIGQLEKEGLGWLPLSQDELWERIKKRAIGDFTRAVTSFVGRCQKAQWTPATLAERIVAQEQRVRAQPEMNLADEACLLFWEVCQKFFTSYLERLTTLGKTDFDHLMMDAASKIFLGKTRFRSNWSSGDLAEVQHVYVDEYQDFSHLFNSLREAIQQRNPTAKFFCVGDDWQAINGFAGSDLGYFHGFQRMFSESRKLEILRNYRSAPEIVNLGNRVMSGKGSPSVPTKTFKGRVCQIFTRAGAESTDEWEECVEDQLGPKAIPLLKLISRAMQEDKELLVLFRNRVAWSPIGGLELPAFREKLLSWFEKDPKKRVIFSTTHSYKGGEADQVVLVDPEDYPLLHEERMFSQIFGDTDESITEDERRLFYVGITRARELLVLLRNEKTRIMNEQPVPVHIPFLWREPIMTAVLNAVASPVFPGERCMVRVSCGPTSLGPRFKEARFSYIESRKVWRRLIDQSAPQNRFECGEFLKGFPWFKELKNLSVEFVWRDRKEVFGNPGEGNAANRDSVGAATPAAIPAPSAERSIPVAIKTPPAVPFQSQADAVPITLAQASRGMGGQTAQTGIFHTQVVGVKHHRMDRAMMLNTGEFVQLLREPANSHDSNAVKVIAACGAQIGYLSRHVAAHLAKGLDAWGGMSQAKVTSVWKQPFPHTLVSIEVCFPLPPGVSIPPELDSVVHIEDSPFTEARRSTQLPSRPVSPPASNDRQGTEYHGDTEPTGMEAVTGKLTYIQLEELDLIKDNRLRELITLLAGQQVIPWPVVGYEGGTAELSDGTMLEVAWPDYKIGIALPGDQIAPFKRRKWTIFHAETVTKEELCSAIENAIS